MGVGTPSQSHSPADAALLFCGDFYARTTLVQLAEGFSGEVHIIWGNNDGDQWLLTDQASRFPHVTIHGALAELRLAGRSIGPIIIRDSSTSCRSRGGRSGLLWARPYCAQRKTGKWNLSLVNPGEVMGRLGASACADRPQPDGTYFSDRISNFMKGALSNPNIPNRAGAVLKV